MKKRIVGGLAGILLLLILIVNCPRPASPLIGDWKGSIDTGNFNLRLLFHVEKGADGKISARLLSPDQTTNEIPVNSLFLGLFTGKAKFQVQSIRGQYIGKFARDRMKGEWRQGMQRFPLTLERIDPAKLAAEKTAFPPVSPGSIAVNQKAGGKLTGDWSGTLDTPKKPLRLTMTIVEQSGGLTGVLNSPDQGATHIPLTRLQLGRTDMIFDFDTINGHFVANFDGDGNLSGQWDQRGKFYSVVLRKGQ